MITLPKELYLPSGIWVISLCHPFIHLYFHFFSCSKGQIFLGNGIVKNHLEKFCENCYEMHEFHIDFLLPGLSLTLIFVAKHYCLLVLGFCEYFFGRSTVWEMLYLWSERLLAVGWKALVTTVLGLYCLREGKKNIEHVWLLYFPGGLRSLGRAGWSQSDHRKVFSLHVGVFLPVFLLTEGESVCWKANSFLRLWLPAVLVFAQMVSVFSSLPAGEPRWHLWALHSHSEAAGSRASRAAWALSHGE